MKLDIRSHTDSRGSNKYNESLSDRRAIYHRLVNEKQVDKSRLTAKGYGETNS
jgi:outer membrane protein OmpA-like peptidoglycan-associated protein